MWWALLCRALPHPQSLTRGVKPPFPLRYALCVLHVLQRHILFDTSLDCGPAWGGTLSLTSGSCFQFTSGWRSSKSACTKWKILDQVSTILEFLNIENLWFWFLLISYSEGELDLKSQHAVHFKVQVSSFHWIQRRFQTFQGYFFQVKCRTITVTVLFYIILFCNFSSDRLGQYIFGVTWVTIPSLIRG